VVALAKEINGGLATKAESVDEKVIRKLAKQAAGDLSPMVPLHVFISLLFQFSKGNRFTSIRVL
jgi:hypothetical protein